MAACFESLSDDGIDTGSGNGPAFFKIRGCCKQDNPGSAESLDSILSW